MIKIQRSDSTVMAKSEIQLAIDTKKPKAK